MGPSVTVSGTLKTGQPAGGPAPTRKLPVDSKFELKTMMPLAAAAAGSHGAGTVMVVPGRRRAGVLRVSDSDRARAQRRYKSTITGTVGHAIMSLSRTGLPVPGPG